MPQVVLESQVLSAKKNRMEEISGVGHTLGAYLEARVEGGCLSTCSCPH